MLALEKDEEPWTRLSFSPGSAPIFETTFARRGHGIYTVDDRAIAGGVQYLPKEQLCITSYEIVYKGIPCTPLYTRYIFLEFWR